MHKLLPFRQYDEKDVVNLFSLDLDSTAGADYINLTPTGKSFANGGNWSGTIVKTLAESTKIGSDQPSRKHDSYLGAIGNGNQGDYALKQGSFYPQAPMEVGVAGAEDAALGITLRPTLAWDENAMKLLYYDVKKDELQAVLPGETVPVATKGFFTVTVGAQASDACAIAETVVPGDGLENGASGQFAKLDGGTQVAKVLATGKNAGKNVAFIQIG